MFFRKGAGRAAYVAAVLVSWLLLMVVPAQAADGATALAAFSPGAPGSPSWSVLKLEVSEPGRSLLGVIDDSDIRCPLTWSFVLFQGAFPDVTILGRMSVDFAYGHHGARVHTSGPVVVDYDDMGHDGAEECPTGGGGIEMKFGPLPAGTYYLLQFKAGTPFPGHAVLTNPDGGVRIAAESSGDRVVYLGGDDFGKGEAHVRAQSPVACGYPSADPSTGFCEPGYRWAGGTTGGVDAGWGRSAKVEFRDRPYFSFGATTNLVGVANATVTDPLGRVHEVQTTGVDFGAATVGASSMTYTTRAPPDSYVSGEYVFDIRMNANTGRALAVPWHLSGVDYHFPEEAP